MSDFSPVQFTIRSTNFYAGTAITEDALIAERASVSALAMWGNDAPNSTVINTYMSKTDDVVSLSITGNVLIPSTGNVLNVVLPTAANSGYFSGFSAAYAHVISTLYLPTANIAQPLPYGKTSLGGNAACGALSYNTTLPGIFLLTSNLNGAAFSGAGDNVLISTTVLY